MYVSNWAPFYFDAGEINFPESLVYILTFSFPFLLYNLVVLDYKTLVLLLVKKMNAAFMLGGRGVSVEFCFICNAIRVKYSNNLEISIWQPQLVLLMSRYIKVLPQLINFFYANFRWLWSLPIFGKIVSEWSKHQTGLIQPKPFNAVQYLFTGHSALKSLKLCIHVL